jgi:hypothetical protein
MVIKRSMAVPPVSKTLPVVSRHFSTTPQAPSTQLNGQLALYNNTLGTRNTANGAAALYAAGVIFQ